MGDWTQLQKSLYFRWKKVTLTQNFWRIDCGWKVISSFETWRLPGWKRSRKNIQSFHFSLTTRMFYSPNWSEWRGDWLGKGGRILLFIIKWMGQDHTNVKHYLPWSTKRWHAWVGFSDFSPARPRNKMWKTPVYSRVYQKLHWKRTIQSKLHP